MNIGPVQLTNTVSGVVLGALLIVVGGLAWTVVNTYRIRSEAANASHKAEEAADNTRNVSNGFAGSINNKLDTIVKESAQHGKALDHVQSQLTEHLQWHLTEGNKNG